MRPALAILLFCASLLHAAKPVHEKPVTFRFSPKSRLYVIQKPDSTLWSQHEIAQTLWPKVNGWECKQARVRGIQGEREKRNFLVVRLSDGKVITPQAKYFVRADLWAITPPVPVKSGVEFSAPEPVSFGPPAPKSFILSWNNCPDYVEPHGIEYRIYVTRGLAPWESRELVAQTTNRSLRVFCDGAVGVMHAYFVTAVQQGVESAPGRKGCE